MGDLKKTGAFDFCACWQRTGTLEEELWGRKRQATQETRAGAEKTEGARA